MILQRMSFYYSVARRGVLGGIFLNGMNLLEGDLGFLQQNKIRCC